jgi:ligand-binding sensor domain-containing protein
MSFLPRFDRNPGDLLMGWVISRTRGFRLLLGWLLCLSGLLPLHALDPAHSIHQYVRDSWTRQTGLPGSGGIEICQFPNGYLWLNCGGHLYRFDGVRFKPMPLILHGKEMDTPVRVMTKGSNGKLLVRTLDRTLYVAENSCSEARPSFQLPDGTERVLLEGRDGTLWIGTDCNVYRFVGGKLELVASGIGIVGAIHEDRQGNIWIVSSAGLFRIRQGRILAFPSPYSSTRQLHLPLDMEPQKIEKTLTIGNALLEDPEGTLWI